MEKKIEKQVTETQAFCDFCGKQILFSFSFTGAFMQRGVGKYDWHDKCLERFIKTHLQ